MLPLPSLVFIQNLHFFNQKYFNRPPHSLPSFLPNPCPDMAFYEAANDNVSPLPLSTISTLDISPEFSRYVKMKTKPSLVKFVESFLQFCISHEIEIHFEWDLKSLSLSQLLEAVGESACL